MIAALILIPLLAYLIGAVPFGYLVAKARGVDIFQAGSGNIGATNVGRVLGKKFGILVLLLDIAKGAAPVLIARSIEERLKADGVDLPADLLPVLAGLAAFLGHLFPIYLRFRGGKGVATGAGVVAVLVPVPAVGALFTWIAVVLAFRYVSLASMKAAVVLCVLRLALTPEPFQADHVILTSFCLLAGVLVFVRHQANIGRLLAGSENRIRETAGMLQLTKIIHVMAMGLWFGSVILFTFVVGLTLFRAFGDLTELPKDKRPIWLPVPPELDRQRPSESFPDPLRKEQGSRLAGAAVGPVFPQYFLLQTICGVLALATAWYWSASYPGTAAKVRVIVIGLALLTVLIDWYLAKQVEMIRVERSRTSDAVLASPSPTSEEIRQADQAREEFGRWHTYSLVVSFIALILVTVGMAQAASLPEARPAEEEAAKLVETTDPRLLSQ